MLLPSIISMHNLFTHKQKRKSQYFNFEILASVLHIKRVQAQGFER